MLLRGGCKRPDCHYLHPDQKLLTQRGLKRARSLDEHEERRFHDVIFTETILVPDQYVGLLLGHKGQTIAKIKEKCTAHISISRPDEIISGHLRETTIQGTRHEIDVAKSELNKFVKTEKIDFLGFEVNNDGRSFPVHFRDHGQDPFEGTHHEQFSGEESYDRPGPSGFERRSHSRDDYDFR